MYPVFQNKKVLIVDDTAFMRMNLVKFLIELGFNNANITEADDGQKAIKRLEDSSLHCFDLVISDWNMPRVSGLELLKRIRHSKEYQKDIPFVLITTISEKDKIIEAVSHNLSGYIIKPVAKQKLEETLKHVFKID